MQIVAARSPEHWAHAAELLLAYMQETAVELGHPRPATADEVWEPARHEVVDPSTAFDAYLIAYEGVEPVGGLAVTTHDEGSVMVQRCYVVPAHRRQGVARAFNAAVGRHAERRDADRVVMDVLPSRAGAIEAWRRLGYVEAEPWGDGTMVYLERPVSG